MHFDPFHIASNSFVDNFTYSTQYLTKRYEWDEPILGKGKHPAAAHRTAWQPCL